MKASRANVRHAQSLADVAARLGEVEKTLVQILAALEATKAPAKKSKEPKEGGSNANQKT